MAFCFSPGYDINKVFTSEMEDSFESCLLLLLQMNYRLIKKQKKNLAWELAQANQVKSTNLRIIMKQ